MSTKSKTDKQIVVYLNNEILYSNENEQTTTACNKIDELHKHNVERKKPDIKEYILYDFICINFKNSQN